MRKKRWADEDLISAVRVSKSVRNVLVLLGLKPAGGNYRQVKNRINELNLDDSHFTGMGWNVGLKFVPQKAKPLKEILVFGCCYQSFKLKRRLIVEGYKKEICEICGWHEITPDGRIPLELHHINGINIDNRIENLKILCPNCHSLQSTHRGLNKVKYA
jgi:hypothetical protein